MKGKALLLNGFNRSRGQLERHKNERKAKTERIRKQTEDYLNGVIRDEDSKIEEEYDDTSRCSALLQHSSGGPDAATEIWMMEDESNTSEDLNATSEINILHATSESNTLNAASSNSSISFKDIRNYFMPNVDCSDDREEAEAVKIFEVNYQQSSFTGNCVTPRCSESSPTHTCLHSTVRPVTHIFT